MSSLRKNLLQRGNRRPGQTPTVSTPLLWSDYFDEQRDIKLDHGTFHVYLKGKKGPLIVALHGGGYSGLTWALLAKEIVGLVECQLLAIDLRGHGKTNIENEEDLSIETLSNDVFDVINAIYAEDCPMIIIVGHSMGGAIAVEYASKYAVAGLVVIDVVEGSALESLSSMQSILRNRPTSFQSIEDAIRWCYKSGMTHNMEAARVSVPGQIKSAETGELAASEFDRGVFVPEQGDTADRSGPRQAENAITEEDESTASEESLEEKKEVVCGLPPSGKPPSGSMDPPLSAPLQKRAKGNGYRWRIDLSKTEKFWTGWFRGLSQKFLNVEAPKILLLANINGLDTVLTLGQMQGKFQMQVLARSGHAIHEDQPQHVSEIIASFLVKQRLSTALQGFHPSLPAC